MQMWGLRVTPGVYSQGEKRASVGLIKFTITEDFGADELAS